MQFCRKCGKGIADDSVFCRFCGVGVEPPSASENQPAGQQPSEETPTTPQQAYSPSVCGNCGTRNETGWKFCMGCGISVEQLTELDPGSGQSSAPDDGDDIDDGVELLQRTQSPQVPPPTLEYRIQPTQPNEAIFGRPYVGLPVPQPAPVNPPPIYQTPPPASVYPAPPINYPKPKGGVVSRYAMLFLWLLVPGFFVVDFAWTFTVEILQRHIWHGFWYISGYSFYYDETLFFLLKQPQMIIMACLIATLIISCLRSLHGSKHAGVNLSAWKLALSAWLVFPLYIISMLLLYYLGNSRGIIPYVIGILLNCALFFAAICAVFTFVILAIKRYMAAKR